MPRYVKSHTAQLSNAKVKRLREEHGLGAFGAWTNVMLAAKAEQPEGRFPDRDHLEAALWPESVAYIDALIDAGLVVVHKDGQHAVSGWAKWQSADSRIIAQEQRTLAQREHMRAKWRKQKRNQKARRQENSAPRLSEVPRAENAPNSAPKAEHHSTPIPPLSAPNTPTRVYGGTPVPPTSTDGFDSGGVSPSSDAGEVASGEVATRREPPKPRDWYCSSCPRRFEGMDERNEHMRDAHGWRPLVAQPGPDTLPDESEPDPRLDDEYDDLPF